MNLPSQSIFDPDQFTQQQTENLINEDYQDGISAILKQGLDNQQGLQQIFYPSRPNNSHFINQGQIFQSTQQQQQQNLIQPMQVLTNGEFLKQQMANPLFIKSIKDKYSSYSPTLRLTMTPLDQNEIELDEEDLLGVFERFGNLEVKLEQGGKALLEFKDIYGAYFAWNSLNGVEIPSQKISIGLDWLYENQKQQQNFPLNTLTNVPPISINVGNYTPNNNCNYSKNIQNENMHTSQNPTQQPNSVLKQANSNYINTPNSSSSIRTNDARSNNQNLNPVSKGQNQTIQSNIIKNQSNQIQSHANIVGGTCQNNNLNIISHQNQSSNNNQARDGQNNSQSVSTSLSNNYGGNSAMNNQNGSQNSNNNQCNGNNANNIKYTCRYEIQISNDKDFQVARKIIGSRGENMKAIIKKCLDHNKKKGGYNLQNDEEHGVKLRLRGKGSGYKEGPEKQESQEALHLCVSSMYYNMYKSACYFVEELLQNIYDEYYKMCQQNNLKRERVHIKKQESTNGKGGQTISTVPQQQQQQQQQPQQQQSQPLNQIPANPMQQQQSSTQNLQQIHSNNSIMSGSNTQKQNNLQQQQVQYLPINKSQQNNSNQLNTTTLKDAQNTINTTTTIACTNNNNINNNSDLNNQIKYEKIIPFQTDKNFELSSSTQQSQGENQEFFSSNEDLEKNSYENSFIQNSNENDSDSPSSASLNNRYEGYGYIHLQNPSNSKMSEKQIISLIEQRNKARKESNFQEADRIRNFLKNNGIALMDEKGGRGKGQDVTTWKYSKNSNPQQQQQLQNSPNAAKSNNNNNKQNNNQQQVHLQQQIQSQNNTNTHSIVNTNNNNI
ncbi:hypothetical protein TTHERM_00444130 (macronuclear) [Tetrahymena thermophila SB210]|uniref:KHDC4/BBP-like KH-domain type I domain-containing protein n=1 Tax=Tetrahymena thermophila (strain SB210) TaxID=312017 RepID=I7M3F2_TETTS|nr:hypothetical protein TTHERM_00444130 [Tetrahymena thermophila SB210]EAS03030.1 hypothetical protein TTHERM_00444130 [Tetrahymena thermophila SB210]|eukprot:XP_001023275.1 hypothetical protein TTHERM_00444130 [Tetrahymena thermophila SB210]